MIKMNSAVSLVLSVLLAVCGCSAPSPPEAPEPIRTGWITAQVLEGADGL